MTSSWIVQSYFYNDDVFNFNYAQAKAATGNTSEGEEVSTYFFLLLFFLMMTFSNAFEGI
jgi:hypothetical protein